VANLLHLGSASEHVRIEVLRRKYPHAADHWDGNWVDAAIEILIPPWRGSYVANLRTEEFASLRNDLERMRDGTVTMVSFDPMEPWVRFTLAVNRRGGIRMTGSASPEGGGRIFGQVALTYEVDWLDLSYLPGMIAQLKEIERAFPVMGEP
jgi:hypothetical protein